MKAYRIDPKAREITEVEYDGTPLDFIRLFPYNWIEIQQVNKEGDTLLFNGGGMENKKAREDGVWGIYCPHCEEMHFYVGVALLFNREKEDEPQILRPVAHGIEEYREIIEWGEVVVTSIELQSLEDLFADFLKPQKESPREEKEEEKKTLH